MGLVLDAPSKADYTVSTRLLKRTALPPTARVRGHERRIRPSIRRAGAWGRRRFFVVFGLVMNKNPEPRQACADRDMLRQAEGAVPEALIVRRSRQLDQ